MPGRRAVGKRSAAGDLARWFAALDHSGGTPWDLEHPWWWRLLVTAERQPDGSWLRRPWLDDEDHEAAALARREAGASSLPRWLFASGTRTVLVTGADVLQALADDDLDAMACCRCVLNSRFGLRPYDRWEQEGGEREAGRVGELWREAAERIACEDPAHLNPPFWLVTAARALTGRLPEGDRPAALALVDEDRTRDEARSAFRLLRPLLAEALASIAGRYPFDAHQKRPGCARED